MNEDIEKRFWADHLEAASRWCKEEADWLLELVDPAWGRPAVNSSKMTIVQVARRCGMAESSVWRVLHAKKTSVRAWWMVRWAVNRNVSGHATYEDWARDNGAQIRDLCINRFSGISEAAAKLDLPNNLWSITRGDYRTLKYYAGICLALGVAMPERRRNENVAIVGKLDDKLTSPPLWAVEIPRGLLAANMTTDHIRAWMLLESRPTPRSVAAALGLPTGYVATLLLDLERRGLVTGDNSKVDNIRKYRRVDFVRLEDVF